MDDLEESKGDLDESEARFAVGRSKEAVRPVFKTKDVSSFSARSKQGHDPFYISHGPVT